MDSELEIHIVSCERDRDLLINLIKDLRSYSFFKELFIFVHESNEDKFKIPINLEKVKVFDHESTKEIVKNKLLNYPNCLWLLENFKNFLTTDACIKKLFDIYVLSKTNRILYFDSDILIINEPKEIISKIKNEINFYMQDIQTAYVQTTVDKNDYYYPLNIKDKNINAGLYYINFKSLEFYLNFIEDKLNYVYGKQFFNLRQKDFFIKKAYSFFQSPWWLEQTLVASFLVNSQATGLDQNKYFIPDGYDNYKSFDFKNTEAIHFAGKTRNLYKETYIISDFLKHNIYV